MQRVHLATHRMAQLIDDMLNLSRISRYYISIKQVNLNDMINEIADIFRESQPERQVEFIIQENIETHTDTRLIGIVLDNLDRNVWKSTSKHSTALIEFGVKQIDGHPAYFIQNNRAEFDMKYAQKLYGAYQRLHSDDEFP